MPPAAPPAPDYAAWAAGLVAGTVDQLEGALAAAAPEYRVPAARDALEAAEQARERPRTSALEAIADWFEAWGAPPG